MSSSDGLDLGYHYDPLDHVFAGCDAYADITFTNGTAIGWYRVSSGWYHAGHGIHMDDQKIATFAGAYYKPCYWVRCNTVQEGSGGQPLSYGYGGITGWADQYLQDPTLSPEVHLTFTRCSIMAGELGADFADDYGYMQVRGTHSEFYDSGIGNYGVSAALTNCLFDRSGVCNSEGWTGNFIYLRNCTFHGGGLYLLSSSVQPDFVVEDTSFDGSGIFQADYGFNGAFDYNGYLNSYQHVTTNTDLSPSGIHDTNVASFNWQAGAAGNFYLPTNSPIINAGSRYATNAGLYQFTTQVAQTKEANTLVDIGYHYVALGTNGLPLDTNNDGTPDYLQDANGNGYCDLSEDCWQGFDTGFQAWADLYGFDWRDPGTTGADPDHDGLSNRQEYLFGTNPTNTDTFSLWIAVPGKLPGLP